MIVCPDCQESTSIEIVRDAQPWETPPHETDARWAVRCGACGTTWTHVDRA